jgi:hypothetical protein
MGEESVMGGVVYVTPYASAIDNSMLNHAAANINQQMALAQAQAYRNQMPMKPSDMFANMVGSAGSAPLSRPTPSVPSTAASRVQKADWEMEYDRKEREVDEMIERQRQERERVRIEEESGNDPRGED